MDYSNNSKLMQLEVDEATIVQLKKTISRTQLVAIFSLITQGLIVISTMASAYTLFRSLSFSAELSARFWVRNIFSSVFSIITVLLCVTAMSFMLQYAGRMKRATSYNRQTDFVHALAALNNTLLFTFIGYAVEVLYHLFSLGFAILGNR